MTLGGSVGGHVACGDRKVTRKTQDWYGWRPDTPDARDHVFNPLAVARRLGLNKHKVMSPAIQSVEG